MSPGTLLYQCNICGQRSELDLARLERETASCQTCGSSARQRGVIRALTDTLFGRSLVLPELDAQPKISGLGLTDSETYANRLAEKFHYTNTFYHCEPRLDISTFDLPSSLCSSADFVLSSEVFEHVAPPVERAFANSLKLLKPGGCLILTVPYGLQPATIEHFPNLHQFHLKKEGDTYTLHNTTTTGEVEEFRQLVFHGGPGSTLELRIFSESDLLAQLDKAGFIEIKVYRTPDFTHGIWWPEAWSLPISARKPFT